MERAAMSADPELTERLMAAYQFVAPERGSAVSLADLRLHMATVGPHLLNPVLRALDGAVVSFWVIQVGQQEQGVLSLLEAAQDAPWRELDEGVEIDGVIYTHMLVTPK
jgi:hypothetical protein